MSVGTIVETLDPVKEDKMEQETHSVSVLVLGESGAGKTASLRNMDPETTLLIQPVAKSLPFRATQWGKVQNGSGSIMQTYDSAKICDAIKNAHKIGKKAVVVDDWQYVMARAFMDRALQKGYDKFTEIGLLGWNTLAAASEASEGVNVYFLSHVQQDAEQTIRAKTIGRMVDEKIVVEGMFPIVLRSVVHENEHWFLTKNSGQDTVKTPMGMFEDTLIPNDLAEVDRIIRSYYTS